MKKLTRRQLQTETSKLQTELDRTLDLMRKVNIDTDEYDKLLRKAEKLNELISAEHERKYGKGVAEKHRFRISGDTAIVVAANIVGLVLIIHHERVGVITSKALGFVIRGRV